MKKRSSYYGIGKVFSFTLTQQFRSKGFRAITILLAAVFLLLPAIIMPVAEMAAKDDRADGEASPVTEVYVVDQTQTPPVDFNFLSQTGDTRFAHIRYIACPGGIEEAAELAGAGKTSLILALDERKSSAGDSTEYSAEYGDATLTPGALENTTYRFSVLRTDETDISKDDAKALEEYINLYFRLVLCEKAGISYEALAELSVPVNAASVVHLTDSGEIADDPAASPDDPTASIKKVLSWILPYVNVMLLYFLVLFYGQNVANCVIMEKTSKLMDTFLVSVKPAAMIFGKVFAVVAISVIQFLLWIAALTAGFGIGSTLVKTINPDSDMALLAFFDMIGNMTGIFSVPGVILALVMIVAAFMLYCGLAAIGGSLASKPEDLSSTNSLFTLALIVSFFAVISTGAITGSMPEAVAWYDYVPFTSILVTPSRILLGYVSLPTGCISLAIVLATVVICIAVAGRLYKMMSLYKGNVPKPADIIGMLKNK